MDPSGASGTLNLLNSCHSGYLEKKSTKLMGGWSRQFFALYTATANSNACLKYGETQDSAVKGIISLPEETQIKWSGARDGAFTIEISVPGRKIQLRTVVAVVRDKWMEAIATAVLPEWRSADQEALRRVSSKPLPPHSSKQMEENAKREGAFAAAQLPASKIGLPIIEPLRRLSVGDSSYHSGGSSSGSGMSPHSAPGKRNPNVLNVPRHMGEEAVAPPPPHDTRPAQVFSMPSVAPAAPNGHDGFENEGDSDETTDDSEEGGEGGAPLARQEISPPATDIPLELQRKAHSPESHSRALPPAPPRSRSPPIDTATIFATYTPRGGQTGEHEQVQQTEPIIQHEKQPPRRQAPEAVPRLALGRLLAGATCVPQNEAGPVKGLITSGPRNFMPPSKAAPPLSPHRVSISKGGQSAFRPVSGRAANNPPSPPSSASPSSAFRPFLSPRTGPRPPCEPVPSGSRLSHAVQPVDGGFHSTGARRSPGGEQRDMPHRSWDRPAQGSQTARVARNEAYATSMRSGGGSLTARGSVRDGSMSARGAPPVPMLISELMQEEEPDEAQEICTHNGTTYFRAATRVSPRNYKSFTARKFLQPDVEESKELAPEEESVRALHATRNQTSAPSTAITDMDLLDVVSGQSPAQRTPAPSLLSRGAACAPMEFGGSHVQGLSGAWQNPSAQKQATHRERVQERGWTSSYSRPGLGLMQTDLRPEEGRFIVPRSSVPPAGSQVSPRGVVRQPKAPPREGRGRGGEKARKETLNAVEREKRELGSLAGAGAWLEGLFQDLQGAAMGSSNDAGFKPGQRILF